jgi:hypothetical protein
LAERFGYRVEFCRVDPGLDECLRRNALRSEDRIIPEDVIVEMYGKMETLGPLRHKIVGEQRVNMGGLLGSTIVLTCSCGKKVNIVDADHFDREVS